MARVSTTYNSNADSYRTVAVVSFLILDSISGGLDRPITEGDLESIAKSKTLGFWYMSWMDESRIKG